MKNKNTKKLVWFVFYAFISYIILMLALKFVFFPVLVLAAGTSTPIINVLSDGMSPEYKSGDTIMVRGIEKIEKEDVIVYNVCDEDDCKLFISRVIEINEDEILSLRSDRNIEQFEYEKSVSKNQILGTPSSHITKGIIYAFQIAFILAILFLATIFTHLHSKRFYKEKTK